MVIDMQRETRGVSSRLRFGHDVMLFASRIKWAEPELRGLGALVKEGDRVIPMTPMRRLVRSRWVPTIMFPSVDSRMW